MSIILQIQSCQYISRNDGGCAFNEVDQDMCDPLFVQKPCIGIEIKFRFFLVTKSMCGNYSLSCGYILIRVQKRTSRILEENIFVLGVTISNT